MPGEGPGRQPGLWGREGLPSEGRGARGTSQRTKQVPVRFRAVPGPGAGPAWLFAWLSCRAASPPPPGRPVTPFSLLPNKTPGLGPAAGVDLGGRVLVHGWAVGAHAREGLTGLWQWEESGCLCRRKGTRVGQSGKAPMGSVTPKVPFHSGQPCLARPEPRGGQRLQQPASAHGCLHLAGGPASRSAVEEATQVISKPSGPRRNVGNRRASRARARTHLTRTSKPPVPPPPGPGHQVFLYRGRRPAPRGPCSQHARLSHALSGTRTRSGL